MTPECLAGAKERLAELRPGERFGLELVKEDVLASWIERSGEGRLLLVVTSLPGKGWIMRVSWIHKHFIEILNLKLII